MSTTIKGTYFDNEIFQELSDSMEVDDLSDFLQLFIEEMSERVDGINDALSSDNKEKVVFYAHKIASGLSTVGIEPLLETAKKIENNYGLDNIHHDEVVFFITEVRGCMALARQVIDDSK